MELLRRAIDIIFVTDFSFLCWACSDERVATV